MFVKKTVYVEKREGEDYHLIFPTPGFSEERLERMLDGPMGPVAGENLVIPTHQILDPFCGPVRNWCQSVIDDALAFHPTPAVGMKYGTPPPSGLTDEEIRLRCLELVVKMYGATTPFRVQESAAEMARFVKGETEK